MLCYLDIYPSESRSIANSINFDIDFDTDRLAYPRTLGVLVVKKTVRDTGIISQTYIATSSRVSYGRIRYRNTTAMTSIADLKSFLRVVIDNMPDIDGYTVTATGNANRVELRNVNEVLIAENNVAFGDGTYPEDSKYYANWISNRWKDKPTLELDTTNTNHNQISLKGSATYGNEADGFVLFGVIDDDETFIETVDGAATFEFTTLEDVEAGDYSFRIYPFKAPPAEGEDPVLGTPSDLLTVTVSDTDPTVVKT